MADPTAPKDSLNPNNPPNPPSDPPPSPILAGQFVVAPDQDGIFKQPPPPSSPSTPPPPPTEPLPIQPAQPTGVNLPLPEPPLPPSPFPPQTPPSFPPTQPDPTPYTPPPPSQSQFSPPPSQIKRARVYLIILGIFLIVVILAALLWFFVLGQNRKSQPAKTEAPQEETPTPPSIKRTTGGFADLPQATETATPAASPAQQ